MNSTEHSNEIILTGGVIRTVEDEYPIVEAVAVKDGRIAAAGDLSKVRSSVGADAREIDLNGRTMLPGFVEAHTHILWAAKTRGAPVVDVRAVTVPTYRAVLAKMRRRVAEAKPGEHILFFGLDAQLHPDLEEPSRDLLDEIAPNNPIGIQTSNCHSVYLNSLGLAAFGIDESTPTPVGSIFGRDKSGRLNGKIGEAATWDAVDVFYRSWGEQRLTDGFKDSIWQFIRQGITTVTEHLYLPHYRYFYQQAAKEGLPMPRIAAYQQATAADLNIQRFDNEDDRLWMAGVKIHADGSPFVGNIWLSEPYLENRTTLERMNLKPGHTGHLNYPQDYFERMVRAYFNQGWQMSIHTQGDRTIDMVLDLVEDLLRASPRQDHRFRLEHCALMTDGQIERANKLGVLSSFFVNHIPIWGAPIEDALFGSQRAAHYMPIGSAVRSGMRISLHADTPMTDPSALFLMQAATVRRANDGRIMGPKQRIDLPQALKAVTIDAAFQIGKEKELGSIRVGKHADFAILDQDPFEQPLETLSQIQVCETYLAGKSVWQV